MSDRPSLTIPVLLVTGGDSVFARAEDLAEVRRRLPAVRVERVPGAGHAVQSDRSAELSGLIRDFVLQPG